MFIDGIPIWSESLTYMLWQKVRTADSEKGYVAAKAVPAGTPLTNEEYWIQIFPSSAGGGGGTEIDVSVTDITSPRPAKLTTLKYGGGYKEYQYLITLDSVDINTSAGTIFRSVTNDAWPNAGFPYPEAFVNPPSLSIACSGGNGIWATFDSASAAASPVNLRRIILFRATSLIGAHTEEISIIARGI